MTPSELETYCRQQYNAVNDTFFAQAEIFNHLYYAQMRLATEAHCIRRTYTTASVAGTQEYAKPTHALSIKRLVYNGTKLQPISFREDDAVNLYNSASAAQGTPAFYFEWGDSFFLRPVPDTDGLTITIYTYDKPQTVTASTTLDVPARYESSLFFYVLQMMALKDKNFNVADRYGKEWESKVQEAIRYERKALRGDSFYGIQDSEMLQESVIGAV